MKPLVAYLRLERRSLSLIAFAAVVIGCILTYRLGSITYGLGNVEIATAHTLYGWHGIYDHPLFLPLEVLRSIILLIYKHQTPALLRLPNAIFGSLAILTYAYLIKLWHGPRTAWLASILFACSAWLLHVSRLASNDVIYLSCIPLLLIVHITLQHPKRKTQSLILANLAWGLLLYVPGLVWLVAVEIWWQHKSLASSFKYLKTWWQKALFIFSGVVWLPLLLIDLTRAGQFKYWLGLPQKLPSFLSLLKDLCLVPFHLIVRGPYNPEGWLGHAPIFDIFSLVAVLLGLYFYAKHWKAGRSHLLSSFLIPGIILIGLGGSVSLSLLVPLLYVAAATGIAYLLQDWLKVFPSNPIARGLGIGLIIAAIGFSCSYNLRSYFVAWPHNAQTIASFRSRL